MVRSRQKEKWIIYTLTVLLCLVLSSFWLMCNIYAKYSAQASGSDDARVAKFEVAETDNQLAQQIKLEAYPGFEEVYKVNVTNKSEVAIQYTIDVKNQYGNLPLKIQMLDSGNNEISTKSAEISAQDQTSQEYKLKISWPKEESDLSESPQNPDYAGKVDVIEITLKTVQKD